MSWFDVADKGSSLTSEIFLGAKLFHSNVVKVKEGSSSSVFTDRTDESSASQYFQFYGYLSQQQNMLQDFIRTSTYQKAILGNFKDFQVSTNY